MDRTEVRARIENIGVIPAIRVSSAEDAYFAVEAVIKGGIQLVEIALTVPDAPEVISNLVRRHPVLVVGGGGVHNPEAAQACLDAGALFLTTDSLDLKVVEFAARKDVVAFPGALTPTEVITAWDSGCDFVKVVPCAHIGGQIYLRSLHEMFPQIPLIAAGGINQQSASQYILAGAVALGIGHELIPPRAIHHRDGNRIAELSRRFASAVKSARGG